MNIIKKFIIGLISLTISCGIASAQTTTETVKYEPGNKLAAFVAQDQHGANFQLDGNTKFLLVSFDMETGKKANAALHPLGKDYLPSKKAAYVANIYGMPAVGRFFAFKKMKSYSHRIVYGDDANLLVQYPQQAARVTVLKLDGKGKILTIKYWDPTLEVLDAFLK